MKERTPIEEILRLESNLTNMFDSDYRVGQALLEYIRANRIELLRKEEAYHSRIKTEELNCPFDFTSRCTMGKCDYEPQTKTE